MSSHRHVTGNCIVHAISLAWILDRMVTEGAITRSRVLMLQCIVYPDRDFQQLAGG